MKGQSIAPIFGKGAGVITKTCPHGSHCGAYYLQKGGGLFIWEPGWADEQ